MRVDRGGNIRFDRATATDWERLLALAQWLAGIDPQETFNFLTSLPHTGRLAPQTHLREFQ